MKQLSLRELLLIVVIVAVLLGWWFDRRNVPSRYQVTALDVNHVCIVDTAIGQIRMYPSGNTFTPRRQQ
jgi:hypothetical protein